MIKYPLLSDRRNKLYKERKVCSWADSISMTVRSLDLVLFQDHWAKRVCHWRRQVLLHLKIDFSLPEDVEILMKIEITVALWWDSCSQAPISDMRFEREGKEKQPVAIIMLLSNW